MKKILILFLAIFLSSCLSDGSHFTFVKEIGVAYRDDRTLIDNSFQKTWYTITQKSKNGRPFENFGKGVKIIDNMVTYLDGRLDLVRQVYYSKDEKGNISNLVIFYDRDYSWILHFKNGKLYIELSEGATIILTDIAPPE